MPLPAPQVRHSGRQGRGSLRSPWVARQAAKGRDRRPAGLRLSGACEQPDGILPLAPLLGCRQGGDQLAQRWCPSKAIGCRVDGRAMTPPTRAPGPTRLPGGRDQLPSPPRGPGARPAPLGGRRGYVPCRCVWPGQGGAGRWLSPHNRGAPGSVEPDPEGLCGLIGSLFGRLGSAKDHCRSVRSNSGCRGDSHGGFRCQGLC